MKHYTTLVFFLCFSQHIFSQDQPFKKAPRQISVEAGGDYLLSSDYDSLALTGVAAGIDYGWQLSGFAGGRKVYLSVPFFYDVYFSNSEGMHSIRMLSYGWTVRHELAKEKKIIPFLGYALLLSQLSIKELEGGVIGHQTRFEAGLNLNSQSKATYFFKADYGYHSFRAFGLKTSEKMQIIDLKFGIRF